MDKKFIVLLIILLVIVTGGIIWVALDRSKYEIKR